MLFLTSLIFPLLFMLSILHITNHITLCHITSHHTTLNYPTPALSTPPKLRNKDQMDVISCTLRLFPFLRAASETTIRGLAAAVGAYAPYNSNAVFKIFKE